MKLTKAERKLRQQANTKARADAFFAVYYHMGQERGLEALQAFASKIGQYRAMSTFKRWSSEYGWQNKVKELDAKLEADRDASRIAKIEAMNERQAQDARNLQALGRAGMTGLVKVMKATGQLDLAVQDIVALVREGAKLERLAMGEATDRTEAVVLVYNVMLLGVVEIFKEVYTMPDREQMLRTFAQKIDEFRDRKLLEIAK